LVLSDVDIKREITKGNIKIEPYDPLFIQSSSLDVHLGKEISKIKPSHDALKIQIDLDHPKIATLFPVLFEQQAIPAEGYALQPQEFILSDVSEKISLGTKISARIEGRSTLARFGLTIHNTAPTVHSTYHGNLKLEICNHGPLPIILKKDMKIAQIIFEYLKTASEHPLESFWQGV
jgi:dCTP deaminase